MRIASIAGREKRPQTQQNQGLHHRMPARETTMAIATTDRQATADPGAATPGDFLGHPRGLSFLFGTEMWERFSYYGMRALLVLYMVRHLLQPGNAENVIGLATLRSFLETVYGPLGVQPFSSHIMGYYTGFVYLTPIFGGLIAD